MNGSILEAGIWHDCRATTWDLDNVIRLAKHVDASNSLAWIDG